MKNLILISVAACFFTRGLSQNTPSAEPQASGNWEERYNFLLRTADLYEADSAIYFNLQALELARENNNIFLSADVMSRLGNNYRAQGNYSLALEYYDKVLRVTDSIEDSKSTAGIFLDIGYAHKLQEDYETARDYYTKGLAIYKSLDDSANVALAYNRIAVAYYYEDSLEEAKRYYLRAATIAEKTGDAQTLAQYLVNIGIVFYDQKQYRAALIFLEKSLALEKKVDDTNTRLKMFGFTGECYFELLKEATLRGTAEQVDELTLQSRRYLILATGAAEKDNDVESAARFRKMAEDADILNEQYYSNPYLILLIPLLVIMAFVVWKIKNERRARIKS
ncbi:MAG: tetratricopeptide repeat protein [Bacteroidota bacterium]